MILPKLGKEEGFMKGVVFETQEDCSEGRWKSMQTLGALETTTNKRAAGVGVQVAGPGNEKETGRALSEPSVH